MDGRNTLHAPPCGLRQVCSCRWTCGTGAAARVERCWGVGRRHGVGISGLSSPRDTGTHVRPRARACSSCSRISTPPSPRTNPSRRTSNGRGAPLGSSARDGVQLGERGVSGGVGVDLVHLGRGRIGSGHGVVDHPLQSMAFRGRLSPAPSPWPRHRIARRSPRPSESSAQPGGPRKPSKRGVRSGRSSTPPSRARPICTTQTPESASSWSDPPSARPSPRSSPSPWAAAGRTPHWW